MSPRHRTLVLVGVLLLTLAGGAIRTGVALHAHRRLSADERAYLRLARDLRTHGTYGDPGLKQARRWAPGTPALFAAAGGAGPALLREGAGAGSPASVAQVVVSTIAIPVVFALAALLGGTAAGLVAALVLAAYPPAVAMAGTFLSEPLGGLAFTGGALAVAWALRRGGAARFAAAGLLLGLSCLVRADLLAPAVVIAVATCAAVWRSDGRRAALAAGGALLACTLVVIAPWSVATSLRLRQVVPVTSDSAGTLYIATFLPGGGTVFGFKRALRGQVCHRDRAVCGSRGGAYRPQMALQVVAERHRDLPYERSLQTAVLGNLRAYALGRPLAFGRMLAGKAWRLWGGAFRGTDASASAPVTWLHRGVVAVAIAGLLAGLWRRRDPALAILLLALLVATVVNVLFVAEARHNVRLMPVLVAAGAAGWAQALRRVPGATEPWAAAAPAA